MSGDQVRFIMVDYFTLLFGSIVLLFAAIKSFSIIAKKRAASKARLEFSKEYLSLSFDNSVAKVCSKFRMGDFESFPKKKNLSVSESEGSNENVFSDVITFVLENTTSEQRSEVLERLFQKSTWIQLASKASNPAVVGGAGGVLAATSAPVLVFGAIAAATLELINESYKTLYRLEGKFDLQFEMLRNRYSAELQSLFEEMKENFSGLESIDEPIRLFQMKSKLKVLRNSMISDMRSQLMHLKDPSDRRFMGIVILKKEKATRLKRQMQSAIDLMPLVLMSVEMESVISQILGEEKSFVQLTVPLIEKNMAEINASIQVCNFWVGKLEGKTSDSAASSNAVKQVG